MKTNLAGIKDRLATLGYICLEPKKVIGTQLPLSDVVIGWSADADGEIVVPGIAACIVGEISPAESYLLQDVARYVEGRFGALKTVLVMDGEFLDSAGLKIPSQDLAVTRNESGSPWNVYSPELTTKLILDTLNSMRSDFAQSSTTAFTQILLRLANEFPYEKDGQYLKLSKDVLAVCWLKLAKERGLEHSEMWSSPTALITAMINLARAGHFEADSINDPFMGTGELLRGSAMAFRPSEVYGFEINSDSCEVAKVMLAGIDSQIKNSDTFKDSWPKVDLVISHPPFGVRSQEPILAPTMATKNVELAAIDFALASLKPNGRAVLCLTRGWTFRTDEAANLRRYLATRADATVKAIIGLPPIFKYTKIETCLLVLEKSPSGETLVADLGADWEAQLSVGSELLLELGVK